MSYGGSYGYGGGGSGGGGSVCNLPSLPIFLFWACMLFKLMSLTFTTGHSTVPLPIIVPEASTPSKPPNPPVVQIPSACDTSSPLRLFGDVLYDKPCADLQALVVVHRSRQGSIGGYKCS
jgi:hypothetical protein